jgi:hypothetical protein
MAYPGGRYPGPGIYPGAVIVDAPQCVAPRESRTAAFLTVGATTATFERPAVSASFEQAEALIVR